MSHYRDLNKELVEQVQTMRRNMKLYCDEIIHLKGELMEKHESEVTLRKRCYNWAVNNFLQLIQFVQPDCDILPVLKEHLKSQETISRTSAYSSVNRARCRSRTSGERSPNARSRSSLLAMELQRSNSIINIRQSVCSTSPIRSSEDGNDEEEEHNLQSIQQDTENETVDNGLTQTQILPELSQNLDNIYEESEQESSCQLDQSVYESIEEISDITQIRSTLKDIINTATETMDSSEIEIHQSKIVRGRGRPKKTKTKNVNNDENATIELDEDDDIEKITKKNTRCRTRLTDNEETLQEPRRLTNAMCVPELNESIPISQDINHFQLEETWNSPTLGFTYMTGNIREGACSTPNSRHHSYIKKTTTPRESATLQESSNVSTRPSRQCKPKDLSEPNLKIKIRSDFETKRKRVQNARSKTKK